MNSNRPRDVPDGLLAHVFVSGQLVAHLVVDITSNHDAAGVGERLQPGGHVDAVAINIVVVADMSPRLLPTWNWTQFSCGTRMLRSSIPTLDVKQPNARHRRR